MHKTNAGEKRKALSGKAMDLEREARALARIKQMEPAARIRQEEADRLRAEAEALKGAARIEDLHVWDMEKVKTTKKGYRSYHYWMASWREGSKMRNVHLGSCKNMDAQAALHKARTMKTEALGIEP
jgi:hypothetical protein